MLSTKQIYVIGCNESYEFGLNHQNNVYELTNFDKFEKKEIKSIENILC